MRRVLWTLGVLPLVLPAVSAVRAQETPKGELFASYSYVRAEGGTNLHGDSASIAGNVASWFGLVFDFGGVTGNGATLYTYMGGPKRSYRHDRFTGFTQALFGGAHLTNSGSDHSFAVTAGGGLDVDLHHNVAVRLVQAEYLMTRLAARPRTTRGSRPGSSSGSAKDSATVCRRSSRVTRFSGGGTLRRTHLLQPQPRTQSRLCQLHGGLGQQEEPGRNSASPPPS
jgi:hypothetical protein